MGAVTDGTTRLEVARREAEALLDSIPSGTQVHIVGAGGRPRLVGAFRAGDNAAVGALGRLGVTDADSDLSTAIELAQRAHPPPRRTYVITDRPVDSGTVPSDIDWRVVGRSADNTAITTLSARPSPSHRERLEIVLGLHNYGAGTTARVVLDHDGRPIGERSVQLAAGSDATLSFASSNTGGVLTARLQHQDALAADNVRRLVTGGAAPIRVAARPLQSRSLERALRTHPDIEVAEAGATDVHFAVCEGCRGLPAGTANVMLLPAATSEPPQQVRLTLADRDHPIADGLELDGTTAQLLAPAGDAPAGASVIVDGNGIPVVLAYRAQGRRVVEVRVDPDGAAWPVSTGFPVLIANIAHWLAHHDARVEAMTAGDPLRWPLGAAESRAQMLGPDGATVDAVVNDGTLVLADTAIAGVYRVQSKSGEQLVAVNPAAQDSNLASNLPIALTPIASGSESGATHAPASGFFIVVALVALVVEWRLRLTRARVT
jgi:hypothetical protein